MKYITPTYKNEAVEAKDIITSSSTFITELSEEAAQVSTSVNKILKSLFSKSE